MISRRTFLSGVSAAALALGLPQSARAAPNVIAGAIRWDAWYATNSVSASSAQNALSPPAYQFRAPWFSTLVNANWLQSNGSQANMDIEIQCAANAGLKYWAFDQFDTGNAFTNAWNLYQASSFNSQINWCWVSGGGLLGSTGNFSAQVAQLVTWFQQTNYQKVLTNRPVLYFDFTTVPAQFGGVLANFTAMLTALQSACATAGLGNPYIVVLGGVPGNNTFKIAIGADAISAYAGVVTTPSNQPDTYAQLIAGTEGFWTQCANTGSPIVPVCCMGWDIRPRQQNPPPFELPIPPPYSSLLNYFTAGSNTQRVQHIQDAVTYVLANPTIVPTTLILIYSWTECDEGGGCLIPTLGDPPQGGNTTNVLTALAAVLH